MTLYASPELHAANPPESWTVERIPNGSRAFFGLVIEAGQRPVETFTTRRDAEQAKGNPESWHRKLYAKEARWYAGENIPGWRSWADVKAEHERNAAKWAAIEAERARINARIGVAA
jgi:hypothetical protein